MDHEAPPPEPDGSPTQRPRWRLWVGSVVVAVVAVAALGFVLENGSAPAAPTGTGGDRAPFRPALALAFVRGHAQLFHVTQIMHGRLSVGSESALFDMQMEADVRWQVAAVGPDGTAELTVRMSHVALDVNGEQTPVPAVAPTHLRITTDGRVLLSNGTTLFSAEAQGPSKIGVDEVSAILPQGGAHERAGARWARTVRCVVFGQKLTYVAHSTYVGAQRIDGIDTAVVRTDTSLPSFHLTVRLADLAALMHVPANRVPPGSSISYAGWERVRTISWVDPTARRLMKTVTNARYSTRAVAHGDPESRLPKAGVQMAGTLTMTIERI